MLYEIALTPDSIRPPQEGESVEHLRALGRMLLREVHGQDGALCVGNLCEGRWLRAIESMFDSRATPKTKPLLDDLKKYLKEYSLERPHSRPQVKHQFSHEHEWAKEAVLCHQKQLPFDRIALGNAQHREEHCAIGVVTDLASVVDAGYADMLKNYCCPGHDLVSQGAALTPLIARADWAAFVLPYLQGDNDETPFLRHLVRLFSSTHRTAATGHVIVVTRAHPKAEKGRNIKYDEYARRTEDRVLHELNPLTGHSDRLRIRIVINDDVLNRYIIAGSLNRGSPKSRWAVNLGHPHTPDRQRDIPKFVLEPAEMVSGLTAKYLPKDFLDR